MPAPKAPVGSTDKSWELLSDPATGREGQEGQGHLPGIPTPSTDQSGQVSKPGTNLTFHLLQLHPEKSPFLEGAPRPQPSSWDGPMLPISWQYEDFRSILRLENLKFFYHTPPVSPGAATQMVLKASPESCHSSNNALSPKSRALPSPGLCPAAEQSHLHPADGAAAARGPPKGALGPVQPPRASG